MKETVKALGNYFPYSKIVKHEINFNVISYKLKNFQDYGVCRTKQLRESH